MTPPALDERVTRLEERMAAFSDAAVRLADNAVAIARMTTKMDDMLRRLAEYERESEDRATRETEDRRSVKVAILSLVGVIAAALIAGGFAVVVAVLS